jgi:quaternary ammonium compound-resistance protein SugE
LYWLLLILVGILQASWVLVLKYSDGFKNLWLGALAILLAFLTFIVFSFTLKTIQMDIAMAVSTGIAIVTSLIFAIAFFHEPIAFLRIFFIVCILVGVVGLKLFP